MKVGDLIEHTPSGTLGLIVADRPGLLVQWCDDIKEVEDIDNYEGELEVVSENDDSYWGKYEDEEYPAAAWDEPDNSSLKK